MNDEMKEYDLPEFHGEEEVPVGEDSNPVDEAPVTEMPAEALVEEPVEEVVTEVAEDTTEGVVFEEPETVIEQKPPTKFQKLWRQVSVWALGILSFGLVLYLVLYFAMYRPLWQEHMTLQETSATLEDQLSDYRVDLEDLTSEHEVVTAERDELLEEATLYQGYVHFLDLKNDMLMLQKAYLENDADSATLALSKANNDMSAFEPALTGANEPMVDVLYSKIALLSTVEADTAANIEEVETIFELLILMETDIFGELE